MVGRAQTLKKVSVSICAKQLGVTTAREIDPRKRFVADSPLEEEGFEPSVPEKARLKGSGRL